ncbi:MAG: hypothetical protein U0670_01370 [Anaerolineae bacterium]
MKAIVRRPAALFAILSLIVSFAIVRTIHGPSYTDAYYHYNGAARLASGQGFTEPYLWTYIGAPDRLPESGVFPSHLYWMPFTSISAAAGMAVFGIGYEAAQIPLWLMFWGTTLIGWWLGLQIGGTRRHAWMAGLLTLFSGFFTRYWGITDTFAPYALVGSACLALMGVAVARPRLKLGMLFAAGMCAGFAHLTRADGVLLLLVSGFVVLIKRGERLPRRGLGGVLLVAGYLAVMGFWFARNLHEVGAILPTGGTQAIWFREYNDIFAYPPNASPAALFSDGLTTLLSSRWEAFTNNFGTFIAVEGIIVLAPLMLIALWNRRRDPFLRPFWLYAISLHLVFTLVFPFPGYRGGLFHSAAALIPFWMALGSVGLDDAIAWMSKRRRWRGGTARTVFAGALLIYAIGLSLVYVNDGSDNAIEPSPMEYQMLRDNLPANARHHARTIQRHCTPIPGWAVLCIRTVRPM